jgi:hypothetical protein
MVQEVTDTEERLGCRMSYRQYDIRVAASRQASLVIYRRLQRAKTGHIINSRSNYM